MTDDSFFDFSTYTHTEPTKPLTLDDLLHAMALIEARIKETPAPKPEPVRAPEIAPDWLFVGRITGIPVIESPHAYTIKNVVRGIPSANKPNRNRPYYRRVTIKVPFIAIVRNYFSGRYGGETIVAPVGMIKNIGSAS